MTERKPDIITKWNIKQNKDGIYEARCPTLPNIIINASSADDACDRIKTNLSGLSSGITSISGGIVGFTAEYGLTKQADHSLDEFTVPTDDPIPEPATDGPELHEPSEEPMIIPPAKKHEEESTQPTVTKCYICKHWVDNDCEINQDVCNNHCPEFILKSLEERTEGFCGEGYGNNNDESTDAQQQPAKTGYQWQRITELKAGCALCEYLQDGTCQGNTEGLACTDYKCRADAGTTCEHCKNLGSCLPYQQGVEDRYMCDIHNQPIATTDYACCKLKEA